MNSHKRRNEPVELTLYSNKVSPGEWKSFLTTMLKWKVPGLDFLDFTLLFPFRACEMVFVKKANTIRTFVKGDIGRIKKLGPLIFPFRAMDERKNVSEIIKGGFPFGLYVLRDVDMFQFMVKEQVQQLRVKAVPFLGKLFAFGSLIENDGGKRLILLLNPEKFLEIDMEKNPSFFMELLDRPILKSVHMHSERPLFEIDEIKIGVENFDIFKHSLIAGMSGTGKSKFIEMFVKSVENMGEDTRIVVIDPHNEFSSRLKGEVIDYKGKHIEPLEIGGDASPMTTQLIVQLMISVIGEANKYSERVLFYAVYLLSETNQLSLENINLLLTDSAKRMEFASMAENDEIKRFFSVEFDDIYMHHFNSAVLPILNFISEYELYIGKKKNVVSLMDSIRENKVTIVSFDPQFFGRRMIKFLAGAIIQQMYIFAITHKLNQKTILLIDEFPVVESLVVKNILSETRKFNLYLYLSLQYLGQIQKEILDSILTNVYNVVTFRLSKSDAGYLSSLMDLKVEEFFKRRISPSELEEEKRRIFIDLKVRECVIRLFDGDKYMIPMKVKTVDVGKWRDGTYHSCVPKKLLAEYEGTGEPGDAPFVPFSEKMGEERAAGKVYRMETEVKVEGEEQPSAEASPSRDSPFGSANAGEGGGEPAPVQEFREKAPMAPDDSPDLQRTIVEEAGDSFESSESSSIDSQISEEDESPSKQPHSEEGSGEESPSAKGDEGEDSPSSEEDVGDGDDDSPSSKDGEEGGNPPSSREDGEEDSSLSSEEGEPFPTDDKPDEGKPSKGGEAPGQENFPEEREESDEEEETELENDGMGEEPEEDGVSAEEGSDILTKYLGKKVLRDAVSRRKKASAKKPRTRAKAKKKPAPKPAKAASRPKKKGKPSSKKSAKTLKANKAPSRKKAAPSKKNSSGKIAKKHAVKPAKKKAPFSRKKSASSGASAKKRAGASSKKKKGRGRK